MIFLIRDIFDYLAERRIEITTAIILLVVIFICYVLSTLDGSQTTIPGLRVVTVDGCEYIYTTAGFVTHKGNCTNNIHNSTP